MRFPTLSFLAVVCLPTYLSFKGFGRLIWLLRLLFALDSKLVWVVPLRCVRPVRESTVQCDGHNETPASLTYVAVTPGVGTPAFR